MLYSPKRQRILNFPKYGHEVNQTANKRNLSIQSNRQRSNRKLQFSFNLNDSTFEHKLNSLYGEANLQKTEIKSLYTLNPQQQLQIHSDVFNQNKNIVRKCLIKRQRHNFSSLEDRSSKDLTQKYQKQMNVEDSFITNKTNFMQNTLQEQRPKQLNKNLKNLIIKKTIQQGNKQIEQIKSKYLTLDKSTKTKSSFLIQNQKNIQSDGLFKTMKKLNNFKYSASNLQIKLNQDIKSQKQKPGHSQFLPNNMQQIKQDINKFILSKRKVKPNINITNQTFIEDENEAIQNIGQKHNQDYIAFKINKQLFNMQKFDKNVKIYHQTYDDCQNQSSFYNNYPLDSNKSYPLSQSKKYVISFKTSLIQLKQIVKVINSSNMADIQILVPKALMNFQINSLRKDSDFYNHAKSLFESLGLPNSNLIIKKYSNCFIMMAKNICILIHNEGKIYLGGWNNKYLDEGTKHGLGLQWIPNQYVYYGEFYNSKKSGSGIMKNNYETFVGNWVEGKKVDGAIINQKGKIFHTRTSTNFEHPKFVQNYQNLESDPFM